MKRVVSLCVAGWLANPIQMVFLPFQEYLLEFLAGTVFRAEVRHYLLRVLVLLLR